MPSPSKSPLKPPSKSPARSPSKSPSKTPSKTPSKSPAKSPSIATNASSVKTNRSASTFSNAFDEKKALKLELTTSAGTIVNPTATAAELLNAAPNYKIVSSAVGQNQPSNERSTSIAATKKFRVSKSPGHMIQQPQALPSSSVAHTQPEPSANKVVERSTTISAPAAAPSLEPKRGVM